MDDRAAYAKVHQRLRVVEDKLRRVKSRERIRDVGRGMMNQFSTFNVKHFGAVGDGVTDDQDAIQNAVDALEAKGGGYLVFPQGTYLMNDTIVPTTDNLHAIAPYGQATLINDPATWIGYAFFSFINNHSFITFEGLRFDLNNENQSHLFFDYNYDHVTIKHCEFVDCGDASIYFLSGPSSLSEYIVVQDCYFDNVGYGINYDGPANYVSLERLVVLNPGYQGITIYAGSSDHVYYLTIEDCIVSGGVDSGGLELYGAGTRAGAFYYPRIRGNVVYQAPYGIELADMIYGVVEENVSIEAQHADIATNGWGFLIDESDYCRIEGNMCVLSEKRGFAFRDMRYSTVVGNVAIDNNTLNRADNDGLGGFDLLTDTTGCDYNLFEGNISGNITASGNQDYGWGEYNWSGASASDHNWLVDNVFIGNDTGPVLIRGANTVARNNKGFKTEETGTATIGAGTAAITVNTGIDTSITLTQEMIQVTPHDDMTPAVRFWVTNIVNQSFDINTDANVTGNTDFAYYVTVYRS